MYQNDAQKVLTGEVRLSYCNLIQPRAPLSGQGDPKYSVTILIPKTDVATKADIDLLNLPLRNGNPLVWRAGQCEVSSF